VVIALSSAVLCTNMEFPSFLIMVGALARSRVLPIVVFSVAASFKLQEKRKLRA
jgi:hypothetical protein